MSYSIDLEPTPWILPPYTESDPLEYSAILDDNNQTCLDVTAHGSCGMFLKVHIYCFGELDLIRDNFIQ